MSEAGDQFREMAKQRERDSASALDVAEALEELTTDIEERIPPGPGPISHLRAALAEFRKVAAETAREADDFDAMARDEDDLAARDDRALELVHELRHYVEDAYAAGLVDQLESLLTGGDGEDS
jgi:hypothetical protein